MKKNLLTCSLLSLAACLVSAQGSWDKKTAFAGSKRERGIGFAIGNRGYLGCGQDTNNTVVKDFWEFDPGTDAWTQKATLPGQQRRDAVGFAIGTKGYVTTGMTAADSWVGVMLNDTWEYNPVNNMWTQKANFPGNFGQGIYFGTAFVVNGKGYVCCGKEGPSNYSQELWEYNPGNNMWTQKANFPPETRYGCYSFAIGNYGYVGFGVNENAFTNTWYKYDPSFDSWSPIATFPGSGRGFGTGFSINGNGYIALGEDGGYKDETWQYDPTADSWITCTPYSGGARRSASGFMLGNTFYLGTGKGFTGCRRDMWGFSPPIPAGIQEFRNGNNTVICPNPFVTSATLFVNPEVPLHNALLRIFDASGKEMLIIEGIEKNQTKIDRNDLPAGIYFYDLSQENRPIGSGKIIVQ